MRSASSSTSIVAAAVWPSAQTETQRVSLPSRLVHRNHQSELTAGAVEALLETTNRLDLSEAMADGDFDGFAHGSCDWTVWKA